MLFRRFASTASRRLPPTIRQLLAQEPDPHTTLSVTGHIKSVRKQKRVAFAALNDGSCPEGLQAVLSPDHAHPFVIPLLSGTAVSLTPWARLTNGCSVRLTGRLVQSQGKGQAKELQVDKCEVVGTCDPEVMSSTCSKDETPRQSVRTGISNPKAGALDRILARPPPPATARGLDRVHVTRQAVRGGCHSRLLSGETRFCARVVTVLRDLSTKGSHTCTRPS